MFDIAPTELMLVGMVALIVIGPKDLPKAMRFVGYWVSRARGVARQFRSGFDSMMREAELQEMEKKWAEENERIMREHPPTPQQMLPMTQAIDHEDVAPVLVEAPVIAAVPEPEVPPAPVAKPVRKRTVKAATDPDAKPAAKRVRKPAAKAES
ncbi:MAG: Sec-independent protein translocase protein TatB [Pseudomonadota bacterium]|jgi:sec-independent protein translocase protein TatB|uniref:Twin-arginine translocation protein TatB n=1 Tax=hydrothermal vent metagenome TaxID=652676 RepID=A0A160TN31_9ZZZZ